MSLTFEAVTFDCADALAVGQFWSAVLDRPIDTTAMPPSAFFASIGIGDPTRNGFMFIQVPEGKAVKNRVHLDKAEYGMTWTTLADPEGNEFCIGSPHR